MSTRALEREPITRAPVRRGPARRPRLEQGHGVHRGGARRLRPAGAAAGRRAARSRSRWRWRSSTSGARRTTWRSTSGSAHCRTATRPSSTGCSWSTSRSSLPIVYTPVVGGPARSSATSCAGRADCGSRPTTSDRIPELLRNARDRDVRLIVATDNERILGLGDQGAGGMGIPVGKLALYTAGAGIHPVADAAGLARRAARTTRTCSRTRSTSATGSRGSAARATTRSSRRSSRPSVDVFPRAVLQWEDFKQHNAIRLLDRYRHRITELQRRHPGNVGAWSLAGILAALRPRGERLTDQRLGLPRRRRGGHRHRPAGPPGDAAGGRTGRRGPRGDRDARLARPGLRRPDPLDDDKREFALGARRAGRLRLRAGASRYDLATVVAPRPPTVLIGPSGTPGAFTEDGDPRDGAARAPPIVLPLSNPTAKTEAHPRGSPAWTEGRAAGGDRQPLRPGRCSTGTVA